MVKRFFDQKEIFMEENDIGPRQLRRLWQATGLSIPQFAELLGEKPQKLKDIFGGKQRLPGGLIFNLQRKIPVNLEWFFGDESQDVFLPGAPYPVPPDASRSEKSAIVDAARAEAATESANDQDFVLVQRYEATAGMGPSEAVVPDGLKEPLQFRRRYLTSRGMKVEDVCLINVAGDSMLPTLMDGDTLLIHRRMTNIHDEGIYCIRLDGGLMVKRLQRIPGGVKIISDNTSKYEPIVLNLNDEVTQREFSVIGRMRWFARET